MEFGLDIRATRFEDKLIGDQLVVHEYMLNL